MDMISSKRPFFDSCSLHVKDKGPLKQKIMVGYVEGGTLPKEEEISYNYLSKANVKALSMTSDSGFSNKHVLK